MAIEDVFTPEVIAAVSAAVTAVLGAIGILIVRLRGKGKNWKEIVEEIIVKDQETIKEAIHAVENVAKTYHDVETKRKEGDSKGIKSNKEGRS